jgi:hypothetical protein
MLVIKHDKDGNPVRAKSRIVVLGNHEGRVYEKSQRYAPVLKYSSLCLLVAKAIRSVMPHCQMTNLPWSCHHKETLPTSEG